MVTRRLAPDGETCREPVLGMGHGHPSPRIRDVRGHSRPYRLREPDRVIRTLLVIGVGDRHQPWIRFPVRQGECNPGRRGGCDLDAGLEGLAVPDQADTMLEGEVGSTRPAPDQQVAALGGRDDLEALATRGADHDDVVDSGMSAQGMGGAYRDIPGHQDPDPHVGWIGLQAESGSTCSPPRRRMRRKAAIAPRMIKGEKRFTRSVYRRARLLTLDSDLISS